MAGASAGIVRAVAPMYNVNAVRRKRSTKGAETTVLFPTHVMAIRQMTGRPTVIHNETVVFSGFVVGCC